MKILFLSGSNTLYDGRTRELMSVVKGMSETFSITTHNGDNEILKDSELKIPFKGIKSFLRFLRRSYSIARNQSPFDVLFIDNRKATVPGLIIKLLLKPKVVIYDARELYVFSEVKTVIGKIGCLFEGVMYKISDYIISANEERKAIMEERWGLHNKILVFENFRKLEYSPNVDFKLLADKYSLLLKSDCFKMVSTAGCSLSRKTIDILEASASFKIKHRIILIGCEQGKDKDVVRSFIEDNDLKNVYLLPRLEQDDLLYILSHSDVGIALYHKSDLNNLNCSSGKIFEYAFAGIPTVASDNPPLKRSIQELGIGISGSDLSECFYNIHAHYDCYLKKTMKIQNSNLIELEKRKFAVALFEKLSLAFDKQH